MTKPFFYKDQNNSFVISDPNIPKDWCNYLWSKEGYIARITQNGNGESYYINEKADLCEVNDNATRYIYFRDEETGLCWNPGPGPTLEKPENFSCEHHIAHTTIKSEKDGIRQQIMYFVPYQGLKEIWRLKIENTRDRAVKISVFAVVSFALEGFDYPRYHEMSRTMFCVPAPSLNGMFCSSNHHWAPHPYYQAFLASSVEATACDAKLTAFTGANGSWARPQMLLDGKNCTNSSRSGYDMGAILQHTITIQPGETFNLDYCMGLSSSLQEAETLTKEIMLPGALDKIYRDTEKEIFARYETLSVKTPDERINQLMNNWGKKQVDFCIVGKKGVRDNAQITSALLMYRPEKAKEEILEILRHQYRSGNAVLTWLPLDETRYSDQPFWLIWAVTELLKETGDFSILDEIIEYQDGGQGSVLEHLKAAVNRLIEDRGANGLVKIYFADWNDSLNISDDPEAESVMLSQQFCLALQELSRLFTITGDQEYTRYIDEVYSELKTAINTKAWDGEWYARALSSKGIIGGKHSEGSKLYLNPQVWAVLANLPDEDQLEKLLASVDSMEHDFGFPINVPAYQSFSPHVGRMGLMLPGLYENGGVYCHASAFKIMMDAKTGRSEEAIRTMKKLIPDSQWNPYTQSETEPYVFTNCYAIHPGCYGKADRSWITGTSAWCLKSFYEGILGIQKDYEGLKIDPCLPASWETLEATREFRGSFYQFTFHNPFSLTKGTVEIKMDGKLIVGNVLPLDETPARHIVEITLK